MTSARSIKEDILHKMIELNIEPKRSLGQNFLVSDHIVMQIFEAVTRMKPNYIIEVGPGLGSLTEKLIRLNIPHELIELDFKLAHYWEKRGARVKQTDALQLDWDTLQLPANTLLLSNLPYQISSRLVIDRCLGPDRVQTMVLMFQKEVAQRLNAEPSQADYGFLSVVAQSFWSIDKVCEAAPACFLPQPKVASRVLSFRRKPSVLLDGKFVQFMKMAFQFRRKMLTKNLDVPKEVLIDALVRIGYNEKVRAEEISVENFHKLYGLLKR